MSKKHTFKCADWCPLEDAVDPWLPTAYLMKTDQTVHMRSLIWVFTGRTSSCRKCCAKAQIKLVYVEIITFYGIRFISYQIAVYVEIYYIIIIFYAFIFCPIYLFSDIRPRDFQRSRQLYNDLSMVNYDAFERMSGSTYFGIMDFDEFLIPSRNRTLKEMLVRIWFFYKTCNLHIPRSKWIFDFQRLQGSKCNPG